MSVTTELQTIPEGSLGLVSDVWELKETIREETGFLQQDRRFFRDAYQTETTHVLLEDNSPVGFITVQSDGYILFLGVHPRAHGCGHGRTLVEHAAEQHRSLTCHARTTNTKALDFYKHLDFEISHTIDQYYVDDADAYYLIRGTDRDEMWAQWRD